METATFAGGCFWCTEAVFQRLKGVNEVKSGYTGGSTSTDGKDPTYEEVCSGKTGHAEAVQILYDPQSINYNQLLEVFFATHDPTTLNQQMYDVGTQYRSAIFYHNDTQKQLAQAAKAKIPHATTQIVPATKFYIAEKTQQNFYNRNQSAPYCQVIIDPKINKLLKEFKPYLKQQPNT